jgi:hypothetical protein
VLGPVLELSYFLNGLFLAARVPTPYHIVPADQRTSIPDFVWVNVWVGTWQGRPVSNHYFAIVNSTDERCASYEVKAQRARNARAAVASVRNNYFNPTGVASVRPKPSPLRDNSAPLEEGVWGRAEFTKALEAETGPGDETRQIHTQACTNRAVRCLRCQTVLPYGDYDLHVCPASSTTLSANVAASSSSTTGGGGGLSESLPGPPGALDEPEASVLVNATHVCKSLELCWCEKKSLTQLPEHPGLRETREETLEENTPMFPSLDVRAAAKQALGLREAKELQLGQATAARLREAFDPKTRKYLGHGKLHWTSYGRHSLIVEAPPFPRPTSYPESYIALPEKHLPTDKILQHVDWAQTEFRELKGLIIGDSSIMLKNAAGQGSTCNDGEPHNW